MLKDKKVFVVLVITVLVIGGFYFARKYQSYVIKDSSLSFLRIPEGFKVNIFARDLKNPRVIAFDLSGRMLVSETEKGDVVLIEDGDKNGIAETKRTILSGLNKPHGLAFYP